MIENPWIIVELVLYLGGMMAIGAYFARREMSQADYHMGGKKLPGWILALSERSTGESAWLILGLPGFAYSAGLSAVWIAVGCVSGIVFAWIFLARRFRSEADRYGALTFIDYFAAKFPVRARWIRWYAALLIISFYLLYVAAQFKGGGKTLLQTFGISEIWGILLTAGVVILYSSAGGFFSVVWTDAVQAILMILTFLVTPVVMGYQVLSRGLSVTGALAAAGPGMNSWFGTSVGFAAGLLVFSNFSWFFGYLGGQPQLSTRWMAMKNDRDVKAGSWVAVLWTLLAYLGALSIGWFALALYGPKAVADNELILPFALLKTVSPWLSGLLLVGAIAAIMSTASSLLLVTTSSVTEDIYHKAMKRKASDRTLVMLSRLTLLLVGAVGLAICFLSGDTIYAIVSWAWAGIGCSFSPAVMCAFFWRRTSGAGVLACLLAGFVTTGVCMGLKLDTGFVFGGTFAAALLAAIVFSLVFPEKPAQIEKELAA